MNKTAIVTGSTSGIGLETAKGLAKMGIDVVMAVRNIEKGEAVKKEILQSAPEANIEVMYCDLADLNTVKTFAEEFKNSHDKLDILVNNAGLITMSGRKETKQGLEYMIGVTHFGHFLLTNLLLDLLKASAPARVVTVASNAHYSGKIDFDDLQSEKSFSAFGAYARAKLANIYFTKELAKQLEGTGVNTYAVHPGVVNTGFFKNGNFLIKAFGSVLGLFIRSPEDGAKTSIYCSTDPNAADQTGLYYENSSPKQPSKTAQDPEAAKQLWDASKEIVRDWMSQS